MQGLKLTEVRVDVRKLIEEYLEKLLTIYNEDIASIYLYGSAVGSDFSPNSSNINLLVIFKKLKFPDLNKGLKLISQGISKKITAPLFLTLDYIPVFQDMFPVEFLEMKENHLCLYGEDVLSTLQISNKYLNLFCKKEIMGKLIRLRQAYLEIGLRKKGIDVLMKKSLYSLIPVFRNLLRQKKGAVPVNKEAILTRLSEKFKLDAEPFLTVLRDKRDGEKIPDENIEGYFEKYFNQIEKLARVIDKL